MYYYEHENGKTISKPDFVVEMGGGPHDYFDSPFCKRWWHEPDHHDNPDRRVPDGLHAGISENNTF